MKNFFTKMKFTERENSRTSKVGTVTIVTTLVLLAVLIVVNMIAAALPESITIIDTSTKGFYTFTETAQAALKNVQIPVTVYQIVEGGTEQNSQLGDATVFSMSTWLRAAAALNSNITVQTLDPTSDPDIYKRFSDDENEQSALAALGNNSIIVSSEKRYSAVSIDDIIVLDYDYVTYLISGEYDYYFDGESCLVTALDYVTTDKLPLVCVVRDLSSAVTLPEDLTTLISDANITLQDLYLSTGQIPADCSCVIIHAPQADLSESQAQMLDKYLSGGGKLLLTTNYNRLALPNLLGILGSYGMSANADSGYIMDDNNNILASRNNYHIRTTAMSHDITDGYYPQSVFTAFGAHPIIVDSSVSGASKLFTTVSSAYTSTNATKTESPITVAATFESPTSSTRLVWYSSPASFTTNANYNNGNYTYFISTLNWLCERESIVAQLNAIDLKPNSEADRLAVTETQANLWGIILIGVVPFGVLGGGLAVWITRRRK